MINQKRRWKLSQIFIIFINRRRRKLKEQDLLQLPTARLNWIHQLREESLLIVCSKLVSPWHRRLWLLLGNIFLAGLVDLKWQSYSIYVLFFFFFFLIIRYFYFLCACLWISCPQTEGSFVYKKFLIEMKLSGNMYCKIIFTLLYMHDGVWLDLMY